MTGTTNDALFDEVSLIPVTNVPCNLSSGISIQGDSVFCQGGLIQLTASLSCDTTSVSYQWQGPNGFTASTKTISISNTTTLNSGSYILTITNIYGETAKDTLNVLVKGIGTYGVICPANKTISTSTGSCYANNIFLGSPIVNDNCTGAILTNDAPSVYLLGITPITWMIVNSANDTATCIQTINVADSIPPVINNCPSQVYTTNPVVWNAITTIDNCGLATFPPITNKGTLAHWSNTGNLYCNRFIRKYQFL
ncbi:MAG: hypothetical protein IPO63_04810 [Bacteroidetes bacterium]|nr:hypothetical protein [Bacteroidota bacterium]